jgi:hypothetical protein
MLFHLNETCFDQTVQKKPDDLSSSSTSVPKKLLE